MSNKTEAALLGRTLQDELRAAAQESDDYSLLTRAASALDRAAAPAQMRNEDTLTAALADPEGQALVQAIHDRKLNR